MSTGAPVRASYRDLIELHKNNAVHFLCESSKFSCRRTYLAFAPERLLKTNEVLHADFIAGHLGPRRRNGISLGRGQLPGLTGKICSSYLNSRAILELWNFRIPIRVYTRVSRERPFERFSQPFCAGTRKRTTRIFPSSAISFPAGIRSSQNFYRLGRSPCRLESPHIRLDRKPVITGSKHDR
jgi:hypothetical protein